MNIFILDKDVTLNATYHCNSHVIKLPLEIAQLLNNALWINNAKTFMKVTHLNHPCSIWVRSSRSNFMYAKELAIALCKEYTYRYSKVHALQKQLEELEVPNMPDYGLTPFVKCVPLDCLESTAVDSYRTYYVKHKLPQEGWRWEYKYRNMPKWLFEDKFYILRRGNEDN